MENQRVPALWLHNVDEGLRGFVPDDLPVPPPIVSDEKARTISIGEVGEDLVAVETDPSRKMEANYVYRQLGASTSPNRAFVRSGVAERLYRAAELLPDVFSLQLLDGWRPPAFQRELLGIYRDARPEMPEGYVGERPIVCVRGGGLQVVRESVWVCHS